MNHFWTAPEDHLSFTSYKNGEELRRQLLETDWDQILKFSIWFPYLCSILGKTHDEGLDLCTTEQEIRSDGFRFVVQKTHERAVWSLGNDGFVAVVDDGVNFRQALHDLKVELIDYFCDLWFEPEHENNGLFNPFDDLTFIRVAKK